jgi:galactitol-specific phosphotransferase system IIB component
MCGSSVATSNLAAVKLEDEADRRKVRIVTKKGKVADFNMLVDLHKPDLVVATSQTHARDNIKVFSGVPWSPLWARTSCSMKSLPTLKSWVWDNPEIFVNAQ